VAHRGAVAERARNLLPIPGMGSHATVGLGILGENLASDALVRRGYAIIARRYRTRVGEIDIVALERDVLVFAEVKARRDTRCGVPAESVTASKQRRIITMAKHFLVTHRYSYRAIRFDVVSVLVPLAGEPSVDIIRGAFASDDRW
jgi:putative endonuclease